jgi:hypothetical protein
VILPLSVVQEFVQSLPVTKHGAQEALGPSKSKPVLGMSPRKVYTITNLCKPSYNIAMNTRLTPAFVLLSVLAASAAAALVSSDSLAVAVRPTGNCADNDYECLCVKAAAVNNEIRVRHGKSAKPVPGPRRMLQNAVDHSKELKAAFKHQNLDEARVKVQCGVFIRGENIAMHHGTGDDHVKLCMDQWEVRHQYQVSLCVSTSFGLGLTLSLFVRLCLQNSPGHLENILSDYDYTVIGIWSDTDGSTYCTQTMGLIGQGEGSPTGTDCALCSGSATAGASTTPPTTAMIASTTGVSTPAVTVPTKAILAPTTPAPEVTTAYTGSMTTTGIPPDATFGTTGEIQVTEPVEPYTTWIASFDTQPAGTKKSSFGSQPVQPTTYKECTGNNHT